MILSVDDEPSSKQDGALGEAMLMISWGVEVLLRRSWSYATRVTSRLKSSLLAINDVEEERKMGDEVW